MGEQNTSTKLNVRYLTANEPEMHWLDEPKNWSTGMAHGNPGCHMQYSIESLERQLADEGTSYALQLNAFPYDGDWKNPTTWHLYADGYEVASGDDKFARQCFQRSAGAFQATCRQVVAQVDLLELSQHDYALLKMAQRIARFESCDDGSCTMGKREGRVY